MDGVNFVERFVDACCLLLDLIIRTFSWPLRLLSSLGASISSMDVALSGSTLVEYCDCALFSFLTATEAVSSATCGVLNVVQGWLQTLGGVLESFKMVGHLSCHVAWRIKDVLHRGFVSGSCILRQTCEGLCIILSLILYFVNTVVNIVLISMQNCLSVLAGACEVVADPMHKVVELALTLLTFLYSCLVGASVLLWMPCQLLLDFFGALGQIFFTVVMVDSRSLLITVAILALALLLLNPSLPVLAGQLIFRLVNSLPGARAIQTMLEQSLTYRGVQTRTEQDVNRTRFPHTNALINENDPSPEMRPTGSSQLRVRQDGSSRTTSRPNSTPEDGDSPPTDSELLSLLKEQEERKKCVICQDMSKTVLLLPCRHLCLCRHCANILTQRRPAQQRCCPLCRQSITETLDVFL